MRYDTIVFILVSVLLSSGSQLLMKHGMVSPEIQNAIQSGGLMDVVLKVSTSLPILIGIACFGLSLLLWLYILARAPLSSAYPFVALGILVTVLASSIMFAEPISLAKAAGVGLVMGGVFLVGIAG
jgi:multidrug transporter EmrE-like cation transporter